MYVAETLHHLAAGTMNQLQPRQDVRERAASRSSHELGVGINGGREPGCQGHSDEQDGRERDRHAPGPAG